MKQALFTAKLLGKFLALAAVTALSVLGLVELMWSAAEMGIPM